MERLKTLIQQYSRWSPLSEYVERIEGFKNTDFSISIENSKSLLESIAKEICKQRGQPLEGTESVGKLIGLSFGCLGYSPSNSIRQIGTAISNIGQQMGNFRNEIGKTSHGRTLEELKSKSTVVNSLTGDFLIFSTETVCSFLIEAFETDNPLAESEKDIKYSDNNEFNEFWDDEFGDFNMAVYSFTASDILFNCDINAYKTELSSYSNSDETNN